MAELVPAIPNMLTSTGVSIVHLNDYNLIDVIKLTSNTIDVNDSGAPSSTIPIGAQYWG